MCVYKFYILNAQCVCVCLTASKEKACYRVLKNLIILMRAMMRNNAICWLRSPMHIILLNILPQKTVPHNCTGINLICHRNSTLYKFPS